MSMAHDDFPDADIEIELAGYLAEAEARDPVVEEALQGVLDEDVIDLYQEGLVDCALDRIEAREAAAARARRPRTAIEAAIDRACGIG